MGKRAADFCLNRTMFDNISENVATGGSHHIGTV
jgi:hypothetical protein